MVRLVLAFVCLSSFVVPCGAQETPRETDPSPGETVSMPSDGSEPAEVVPPPTVLDLEPIRGALSDELEGVRSALARIEREVERPTLFEKVGEDLVSNTIWAVLTSTEGEGNLVRWITSVLGLLFMLAKIVFWVRNRRNPGQPKVSGMEAFTNVGLFVATGGLVFILGGSALTGGLETKAVSSKEIERLEERLERLDELDRLAGIAASIEAVRRDLEAVEEPAPRPELEPSTPIPVDVSASLAALEEGLGRSIESSDGIASSVEAIGRDMATDGWQGFQTLLLLATLIVALLGAGLSYACATRR